LEAAKESARKSREAVSKKDQIWSTVNHLEMAHAAFSKSHSSVARKYFSFPRWARAVDKDFDTLCLMAICYRYLGERKLMLDTMEKAREVYTHSDSLWKLPVLIGTNILNPINTIDAAIEKFNEPGEQEQARRQRHRDFRHFYRSMTGRKLPGYWYEDGYGPDE
jgi:hypothetical protein